MCDLNFDIIVLKYIEVFLLTIAGTIVYDIRNSERSSRITQRESQIHRQENGRENKGA